MALNLNCEAQRARGRRKRRSNFCPFWNPSYKGHCRRQETSSQLRLCKERTACLALHYQAQAGQQRRHRKKSQKGKSSKRIFPRMCCQYRSMLERCQDSTARKGQERGKNQRKSESSQRERQKSKEDKELASCEEMPTSWWIKVTVRSVGSEGTFATKIQKELIQLFLFLLLFNSNL